MPQTRSAASTARDEGTDRLTTSRLAGTLRGDLRPVAAKRRNLLGSWVARRVDAAGPNKWHTGHASAISANRASGAGLQRLPFSERY